MSEFEAGSECGLVFDHIFQHPVLKSGYLNPRNDLPILITVEYLDGVPIIPYAIVPLVVFDMSHDHITLGLDLEYLVHHQPLCDIGGTCLVSCPFV